MKHLLKIIMGMILVVMLCQNVLAETIPKIAIVNFQKCIEESHEGQKRIQELKVTQEAIQQTIKAKESVLKGLQMELETGSMMLSAEQITLKENELKEKYAEYQTFVQEKTKEMNAAHSVANAAVIKDLLKIIERISKEEEYDIVLNKDANISGIVLYADDGLDISDRIIVEYNKLKPVQK